MRVIILFTLLSIIILSCNPNAQVKKNSNVWTKDYELKEYKQVDDEIRPELPDEQKRQQLVSYVIKRLKAELPNGVESVSADSLYKLCITIGKDYAFSHTENTGLIPRLTPWTPELEQIFREGFLKGLNKKYPKSSNELCNCVIVKLKKLYPDSVLMPLPHDITVKIAQECMKQVLKTQ